jgi:hypothetical protein
VRRLYVATFYIRDYTAATLGSRCATTRARHSLVDTALASGLVRVRAVTVTRSVTITGGALRRSHSRSAEAVLGRGPLVLGTVLLDSAVLGRLVLLTARAARRVTTLLALDVRVWSVAATRNKVSATSFFTHVEDTYEPPKPRSEDTRLSGVPSILRPSC